MAGMWWTWDRITSVLSIYDVYSALSGDKSYKDVRLQHSGDVVAERGSVTVGILFLYDGVPPSPPPPPQSGQPVGTSTGIPSPVIYWRGIACGGAGKTEAESIFKDIKTLIANIKAY
jgi:hypothetical protein